MVRAIDVAKRHCDRLQRCSLWCTCSEDKTNKQKKKMLNCIHEMFKSQVNHRIYASLVVDSLYAFRPFILHLPSFAALLFPPYILKHTHSFDAALYKIVKLIEE